MAFPSPCGVSFILIESYTTLYTSNNRCIVSVSLRSIIHSYLKVCYHCKCQGGMSTSFRLLAEYHSFLYDALPIGIVPYEFPSPCGVSFILINIWRYLKWLKN